jgi:hypothetical protein
MSHPVLHHWYSALSKALGEELTTSDAEAARTRLYAARREAKDPDLDQISLTISPFDPMRIWLYKKGKRDEET